MTVISLYVMAQTSSETIVVTKTNGETIKVCLDELQEIDFTYAGEKEVQLWPDGPKWASMNLGATTREGIGWYFAWGEVSNKIYYVWHTYLNDFGGEMTDYYDAGKSVDPLRDIVTRSVGESQDRIIRTKNDAAHVILGDNWRMPTEAEWAKLCDPETCTWEWQEEGNVEFYGVAGYKVTSIIDGYTDNFIFLPAAGYRFEWSCRNKCESGHYWSANTSTKSVTNAKRLYFGSDFIKFNYEAFRIHGCSIRPVSD